MDEVSKLLDTKLEKLLSVIIKKEDLVNILESKFEEFEARIHNKITENSKAIENLNEKWKNDLLVKDSEINELKAKIVSLEKKTDDQINRGMRNNIVIKGAPELPSVTVRRENTKELAIDHINSILEGKYTRSEIENCIDRAHRGGKRIPGKPRPIFCNLLMSTFVDEICEASRTSTSNIKFDRQYTAELNDRRNKAS